MLLYAVVDLQIQKAIDFFPSPEEAEEDIENVRGDDPELAASLRIKPFSFPFCPN
ncbi:MAG: hypothetical protein ACRDQ2_08340 [Gaiellales bacterium]